MSTQALRWGILGPGRIAEKFAVDLQVLSSAQLYAVASRNLDKAQSFANQFGARQAYGSYAELLADPQVEAVYIATPHRFHFEQVQACFAANKPVLCEKPLTVNAKQASQLIEEARQKQLFLMEAVWTRYLPIYAVVRSWLDTGQIGDIRLLSSTFGYNLRRPDEDRLPNHQLAGGALLDMGMYNVSTSQWVMGQNPVSFSATARMSHTRVDAVTTANLQYEQSIISQFSCTYTTQCANEFFIYGSEGHICIHADFWGSTSASLVLDNQRTQITRPFQSGGFEYEIAAATDCIQNGLLESDKMPLADTLGNMQVMDDIRACIGLRYDFED